LTYISPLIWEFELLGDLLPVSSSLGWKRWMKAAYQCLGSRRRWHRTLHYTVLPPRSRRCQTSVPPLSESTVVHWEPEPAADSSRDLVDNVRSYCGGIPLPAYGDGSFFNSGVGDARTEVAGTAEAMLLLNFIMNGFTRRPRSSESCQRA
jgi:hypothetical protein